jgi:hypothetical protein
VINAVAIRTARKIHGIGLAARWRHVDLENFVRKHDSDDLTHCERGFICRARPGEFLTRKQAAHIAVASGQVAAEKINWNLGLFTEDLW